MPNYHFAKLDYLYYDTMNDYDINFPLYVNSQRLEDVGKKVIIVQVTQEPQTTTTTFSFKNRSVLYLPQVDSKGIALPIFKSIYSPGLNTGDDDWNYDFEAYSNETVIFKRAPTLGILPPTELNFFNYSYTNKCIGPITVNNGNIYPAFEATHSKLWHGGFNLVRSPFAFGPLSYSYFLENVNIKFEINRVNTFPNSNEDLLGQLGDVSIESLLNGQALIYDDADKVWKNGAVTGVGVLVPHALNDHTDVNHGASASTGRVLTHNSANWQDAAEIVVNPTTRAVTVSSADVTTIGGGQTNINSTESITMTTGNLFSARINLGTGADSLLRIRASQGKTAALYESHIEAATDGNVIPNKLWTANKITSAISAIPAPTLALGGLTDATDSSVAGNGQFLHRGTTDWTNLNEVKVFPTTRNVQIRTAGEIELSVQGAPPQGGNVLKSDATSTSLGINQREMYVDGNTIFLGVGTDTADMLVRVIGKSTADYSADLLADATENGVVTVRALRNEIGTIPAPTLAFNDLTDGNYTQAGGRVVYNNNVDNDYQGTDRITIDSANQDNVTISTLAGAGAIFIRGDGNNIIQGSATGDTTVGDIARDTNVNALESVYTTVGNLRFTTGGGLTSTATDHNFENTDGFRFDQNNTVESFVVLGRNLALNPIDIIRCNDTAHRFGNSTRVGVLAGSNVNLDASADINLVAGVNTADIIRQGGKVAQTYADDARPIDAAIPNMLAVRDEIAATVPAVPALDDITDVTLNALSIGQVLSFDGNDWVNTNPVNVPHTLDSHTDVVVPSPATNDILQFNGTNWVNAPPASGGGVQWGANGNSEGVAFPGADAIIANDTGRICMEQGTGSNNRFLQCRTSWALDLGDIVAFNGVAPLFVPTAPQYALNLYATGIRSIGETDTVFQITSSIGVIQFAMPVSSIEKTSFQVGTGAASVCEYNVNDPTRDDADTLAAKIEAIPQAIPNMRCITRASGTKLTKGGDADGITIQMGTTDAQDVEIIRQGNQILTATATTNTLGTLGTSLELQGVPVNITSPTGGTNTYSAGVTTVQLGDARTDFTFTVDDGALPTPAPSVNAYLTTRIAGGTAADYSARIRAGTGSPDAVPNRQYVDEGIDRSRAYAAVQGNPTASVIATINDVAWIQGTLTSSLKDFSATADNSFTYTGATTQEFYISYTATPAITSVDRTAIFTCYKQPSSNLNPSGSPIVGSRSRVVTRIALTHTGTASASFMVSLSTNQVIRFYVSNSDGANNIIVEDFSFTAIRVN